MAKHERAHPPKRAEEVLSYFVGHPRTPSSLEDVAKWRLQQEAIQHTVEQVSRAIEWLVAEGFLVAEEEHLGAAPMFLLNEMRVGEAKRFLREVKAGQSRDDGLTAAILDRLLRDGPMLGAGHDGDPLDKKKKVRPD